MAYSSESTTLTPPIARQRKRTIRNAVNLLDQAVSIPPGRQRSSFLDRIRNAKQPNVEAKRIIAQVRREAAKGCCANDNALDLSDVQELRVKLIRRDKGIWPPQSDYLHRIERMILEGTMSTTKFQEMAGLVLNKKQFPQVLSADFQRDECRLARHP